MSHDIAIITVVYENYTVLAEFIDSLSAQKVTNFHLFIVDASTNKKEIDTRNLQVTILKSENNGYAHAINEGIKKAQSLGYSFFCAINDDVYFKSDFTKILSETFESHPSTLFGGKIYYAPGYEYHKDCYSENEKGKVIWYAGGELDWSNSLGKHIGVDEVDHGQYDNSREITFVTGCIMCFDEKILKRVGYLDEKYFMYFEDTDYSVRVARNGLKVLYIPCLTIWHKNAQSTGGSGSRFHEKTQKSSQIRFALKHAPWRTKYHILKNAILSR